MNHFLEFEDLAYFVLRQPSVALEILKLASTTGTYTRRLLHVCLGCGGKARLGMAPLVDIQSQVCLWLQVTDHFLNNILGKFDIYRAQVDMHILIRAYDWPKPAIVDTGYWFDYA